MIGIEFYEFRQTLKKRMNFEEIQASGNPRVLSGSIPCHLKRFREYLFFLYFLAAWKFWREAPGLMRPRPAPILNPISSFSGLGTKKEVFRKASFYSFLGLGAIGNV